MVITDRKDGGEVCFSPSHHILIKTFIAYIISNRKKESHRHQCPKSPDPHHNTPWLCYLKLIYLRKNLSMKNHQVSPINQTFCFDRPVGLIMY